MLSFLTHLLAKMVEEQVGNSSDPRITFGSLPDPDNRYMVLKEAKLHNSYEMVWPPVFDADGQKIRPGQYDVFIPDGTLVKVSGNMRM